jgi:hypothetical protein
MGVLAGDDGAVHGAVEVGTLELGAAGDYEPVPRPGQPKASQPAAAMFRRRSVQPSRRGVLHLQTDSDGPVPPDLATWYTERGFHFYVVALRWSSRYRRPRWRDAALAAAFAELDARCEQLRTTDGIDNVIVTAHGEAALAAALWCDAERPGGRADALILYTPSFGGALRRGLDITCPVLVIGDPGEQARGRGRRADPASTIYLGRHVTWLRPADGGARPDASDTRDRAAFFDEMGRWLGAYMYGKVRDQLL